MITVLSTKKLTASQKKTFRKAKIEITTYDAIQVKFVTFEISEKPIENAIFTSKNAVKAVLENSAYAKQIKNCFCVGDKTAELLRKHDQNPVIVAGNAAELADFIVQNHHEKKFDFFCGNRRREELPNILKTNNILLREIVTYKTGLNPQQFDQDFDAVLFFSPSGIQSFVQKNELSQKTAICIGKTTAAEAKKYTKAIEVSHETTVESVIEKTIETCKVFPRNEGSL